PGHALALRRRHVLGHALAVVLEVRLRALREREVLVALARLLLELADVLLERRGLRRLLGGSRRLGLGRFGGFGDVRRLRLLGGLRGGLLALGHDCLPSSTT